MKKAKMLYNYLVIIINSIYSQVHKYLDIDTIFSISALYHTTMNLK